MLSPENKTCSKCKKVYPKTNRFFNKCSKTKCGLVAKCKKCHVKEMKIYMRRARLANRLKKVGLYNGTVSKLLLEKLTHDDLVDIAFAVSRELLYSRSSSRFCNICEEHHNNNHKRKK